MRVHYLDSKIASSNQKITVNLIGAGGTGSHMLTNLAILSETLSRLGHPALCVRTFDPDIVTEHNVGRQAFSKSDIGRNKAEVLVSRINRHFGLQWSARPSKFMESYYNGFISANFTISCVDSVSSRREIFQILSRSINTDSYQTYRISGYWMDIGNSMRSGQVILGTLIKTRQPKKSRGVSTLKTFFDEYPDIVDEGNEPSCSLADSLFKQDLFINKVMATYAADILWNLLHKFVINYRGVYVNLETLKSTPILI
jgi:PRTRC genetic system ThiF family protein